MKIDSDRTTTVNPHSTLQEIWAAYATLRCPHIPRDNYVKQIREVKVRERERESEKTEREKHTTIGGSPQQHLGEATHPTLQQSGRRGLCQSQTGPTLQVSFRPSKKKQKFCRLPIVAEPIVDEYSNPILSLP